MTPDERRLALRDERARAATKTFWVAQQNRL